MELLLRTPRAATVEAVLAEPGIDLHVPSLCDIEVASALRRLSLAGALSDARRDQAVAAYLDLPVTRHGHLALLGRVLELGANLSAYDGAYVALAEVLKADLLTADERLARAVRTHTSVSVV